MKHPIRLLIIIWSLYWIPLHAQQMESTANAMSDALQLRTALASDMADERPAALKGIAQLRSTKNPSGLPVDIDADFAFAAIDIAHRLLAAGKSTAAEEFFIVAEAALAKAVKRTANEKAQEKSQYLQTLSLVRENYLGKPQEAKLDLEAALALQPENKQLQQRNRALLNREQAQASILKKIAEVKEVAR